MQLILRVDSSLTSGAGHAMRILALANILVDECELILFTREMPKNILGLFEDLNVTIFKVDTDKTYIDEISDIKYLFPKAEVIVLDGYGFTNDYQNVVKKLGFRMVIIDDFGGENQNADVIINHSPAVNIDDYKTGKKTKLCLGLDYAILRPPFISASEKLSNIATKYDVFLCLGAADPNNVTGQLIKLLIELNINLKIVVVVGGSNPHIKELEKINNMNSCDIKIYNDLAADKMYRVMSESLIGITPASTVAIESCASRLPLLVGYANDNQLSTYAGLTMKGLAKGIGCFNNIDFNNFKELVTFLLKNKTARNIIREKQDAIFTGRSNKNLLNCMLDN